MLAAEPSPPARGTQPESDIVITNGARALAGELGVALAQLRGLGKKIVSGGRAAVRIVRANRQRPATPAAADPAAIAAVVTEAHRPSRPPPP